MPMTENRIGSTQDTLRTNGPESELTQRIRAVRGAIAGQYSRALLLVVWVVVGALIALPALYVLVASVSADPIHLGEGWTSRALSFIFASWSQWWLLIRSAAFAAAIGGLATIVGTAFAWSMVRVRVRGGRLRELAAIAPLFLAPFVTAAVWVWLGAPQTGVINRLLESVAIPSWLQPNFLSVGGMIFVLVPHYVPISYLFVLSSVRKLDTRMEESSLLCGRGRLYTTFRISLPALRPALLSSALYVSILALGEFSVCVILGQRGGFAPLAVQIFEALKKHFQDLTVASAVSAELMILSLIGLFFYLRSVRQADRFVAVSGKGHQAASRKPKLAASILIWVGTAIYALVTLIIPLGAMVVMGLAKFLAPTLSSMSFSVSNITSVLSRDGVLDATINTVILAIVVPLASTAMGVAIVYLADRVRMRTSRVLTFVSITPIAIPGLILGTGMFFLVIRTPLYGTLALFALAFVAISMTHAVRLISNGFVQIDESLEHAARLCGASRLRTVWTIIVPLIRPSLYATYILTFILTMRELNIAVVLYTPDTTLLSVVAWNASEKAIREAAVIGLLQIALLIVGSLLLQALFRTDVRKSEVA